MSAISVSGVSQEPMKVSTSGDLIFVAQPNFTICLSVEEARCLATKLLNAVVLAAPVVELGEAA